MRSSTARIGLISLLAACDVGAVTDGTGTDFGGGDNTGGGGSGGGSGTSDSTPMTATKFLDQIGQKFCDEAFMCKASYPAGQGITFEEEWGTSAQQCYTESLAYYQPTIVEQQITAGTIKWNAPDAATCLSGIAFSGCTQFWQQGPLMPAACDTAIVGTIADGGTCLIDLQCTSLTSYCEPTTKKCAPDTMGARLTPAYDQLPKPADRK